MRIAKEKNRGITLIALIITIIVLLILAGITVGMLMSNNSILNQAGNARTETRLSGETEKVQLAIMEAASDAANTVTGEITKEQLDKALKNQFGPNAESIGSETGPWKFSGSEQSYRIYSNGNLETIDKSGYEICYELDDNNRLYAWVEDQDGNDDFGADFCIKKGGYTIYENDTIDNLHIRKAGQYKIIADVDNVGILEKTINVTTDSNDGPTIYAGDGGWGDKFSYFDVNNHPMGNGWIYDVLNVWMIVDGVSEQIDITDCIDNSDYVLRIFEVEELEQYNFQKATIIFSLQEDIIEWSGTIMTAHGYVIETNLPTSFEFWIRDTRWNDIVSEGGNGVPPNPKMKIKSTGAEIDLSPYISGYYININQPEFLQYEGQEVIITLQYGEETLKWEGAIHLGY